MHDHERKGDLIILWIGETGGGDWALAYHDEAERDADWDRLRSCMTEGRPFDYNGMVLIQNHYEAPISVTINPARITMMEKGIGKSLNMPRYESRGDDWENGWKLKEESDE